MGHAFIALVESNTYYVYFREFGLEGPFSGKNLRVCALEEASADLVKAYSRDILKMNDTVRIVGTQYNGKNGFIRGARRHGVGDEVEMIYHVRLKGSDKPISSEGGSTPMEWMDFRTEDLVLIKHAPPVGNAAAILNRLREYEQIGQAGSSPDKPWNCVACTYQNSVASGRCQMCDTARPAVPHPALTSMTGQT